MNRAPLLLLLAATAAVYAVLVLVYLPQLWAGGLAPFDLRLAGYDAEAAGDYLAGLSALGKAAYQGPVRLLDTLFPMLLSAVLLLPLGARAWRGLTAGTRLALGLPALGYGLLDLAENTAIARLLRAELPVDSGAVRVASLLTQTKFALLALAVVLALGLLLRGWRKP